MSNLVNAQQISVLKEAENQIQIGEVLEVKININNPYNEDVELEVLERIINGVTLVQPTKPDKTEFHDAIEASFFRWKVDIPAKKIVTLTYKIKLNNLGEYTLAPTRITNLANNEVYLSESLNINVLCNPNNICEENENSLNCPQDCSSGIADGICDYKLDNKCDPDCEYDPDCGRVTEPTKINKNFIFYILGLAVVFIVFFLLRKKR